MHQFSIHTQTGEHLGFLIMLPSDEYEPTCGQLAIKLRDDLPSTLLPATQALNDWAESGMLNWLMESDRVRVSNEENDLMGYIRQEWLIIDGTRFVLNDLEGSL
ncbi:hypothetical protein MIS45_04300 [Wielerella bovis]|uniref:HLGFF motif protein n=1 Tax=Wielerella bovis TaxID=2917790 RepID=UPI00201985BF|nr:hypothetical protein [Wielerella bovis]ULJ70053.1 hypothetical protein MIS45_04300 [Wielerella bovis]